MSEVRLIDANALLSKMVNEPVKAIDGVDFDTEWFTRIADTTVQFTDMVENAPTVDAVAVVRCHECCYWDRGTIRWNWKQNEAICDMFHERGISQDIWTAADYYCADGERR